MSNITVRQAVLVDLDALVPLFDGYRQFYGQSSDVVGAREFLQARFEHGQSVVLLAESDGRAVGFTQLFPGFSSVSMARVFVLNDLYVDPYVRRMGVASALLKSAQDHAQKLRAVRLSLNTDIQNLTAQALYDAIGWQRDQQFYAYHLHLK